MNLFRPFIHCFFYLFTIILFQSCSTGNQPVANYTGSKSCIECHEKEYNSWKGSDHDNAMDSALASTVRGDFDNAVFESKGFTHRFFTRDGNYFVYTKGPDGIPGEFKVAYTFGVRPLQQYLVPFEKGRLQVLPLTWDTERKTWYDITDSVYKEEMISPDDWLYWTNNGQNWNGMCAECHSTNLQKNYDPVTHEYQTTWSEIDVSCESCHGPASSHIEWAEKSSLERFFTNDDALIVNTSNLNSRQLVDQCAYCHSRRTSYDNFVHPREDLFNIIGPQLPVPPLYYPDGQILEEDYVYGSFVQSRMHRNKVRCTNCHDVHSLKLRKQGNALCLQCHEGEKYDVFGHHRHKNFNEEGTPLFAGTDQNEVAVGEGSLCINCHMPGKYFMGVDYRRDHSMRIPRPDLSEKLGTPDACTQCHTDKTPAWAAGYTKQWYPDTWNRPEFGTTIQMAENGERQAIPMLKAIVTDPTNANIIRAAATRYLGLISTLVSDTLGKQLLEDPSPLVRREAVKAYYANSANELVKNIGPLLDDPTLMVRSEVVSTLSSQVGDKIPDSLQDSFEKARSEYEKSLEYTADFATSRHNLGNLYANLGEKGKAIENYKEAIRIDNHFYPAMMNLAMLQNSLGNNAEAKQTLLEALTVPEVPPEINYSLGLLLSEMKEYNQAVYYLKKATETMPDHARSRYNLGLLLDFLGNAAEAESYLEEAVALEPENVQFLVALTQQYLRIGTYQKALHTANTILRLRPNDPDAKQLVEIVERKLNAPTLP